MGIKETPTNFRVYYTSMKEYYNKAKDEANKSIDALNVEITRLKNNIVEREQVYKEYGIVLDNYQEFVVNEYIDGKFLNATRKHFRDTAKENIDQNLWELYDLAGKQKAIHDLKRDIEFYDKLKFLELTIMKFNDK